ncbi:MULTISPECIES: Crp/Fnr family transcriptional regulator [Rhodopseudomonas]|uniref:Crp/Fnr family transcriptional regulator n=1 Tax=Rhodopseudomonas TaxID=1073 RepID=UPI001F4150C4|nr:MULTISPECIES: Crp/Fnr family transcriptional regulator [Rhodopseudomonas]MDF3813084.1 Crp/Fnr family transcriptional regulator [Rhodopseudomonas sp. BAL398]WOK19264.1 Crp/Fnr family transcriptional regulator [Rhodopseudomonas sp. BAL398]
MKHVVLPGRAVLQDAGKRVDQVDFIEDGLVSHFSGSRAGFVETAIVGCFGYVGIAPVLGAPVASQRSIVSLPGSALRIAADDLTGVMQQRPQIRDEMLRYLQALIAQNSQSVLCAAKHEIHQRLARWLLLAKDRIQSDVLLVTHDLLASSMGVRRAGVTNALLQFEADGMLQKTRGALRVVDRPALERRACDCYQIVRDAYAWAQAPQCADHQLELPHPARHAVAIAGTA